MTPPPPYFVTKCNSHSLLFHECASAPPPPYITPCNSSPRFFFNAVQLAPLVFHAVSQRSYDVAFFVMVMGTPTLAKLGLQRAKVGRFPIVRGWRLFLAGRFLFPVAVRCCSCCWREATGGVSLAFFRFLYFVSPFSCRPTRLCIFNTVKASARTSKIGTETRKYYRSDVGVALARRRKTPSLPGLQQNQLCIKRRGTTFRIMLRNRKN